MQTKKKDKKRKIIPSQDFSDSLLINKETIKKLEEEEETKEKTGTEKSAADKTKKPRGRPSKSSLKPEIPVELLDFESEGLLKFVFGFCEEKWGEHWKLTDTEANKWGKATDKMIVKYGIKLTKYWVEINFAITTGMILYPRVKKDIEIAKEKKKNKKIEEEKKQKSNAK